MPTKPTVAAVGIDLVGQQLEPPLVQRRRGGLVIVPAVREHHQSVIAVCRAMPVCRSVERLWVDVAVLVEDEPPERVESR